MSQKDHCDLCDAVVPDDVARLTLKAGIGVGNTSTELEQPFDICQACVQGNTVLQQLMNEAKA
jgi:hypothetical protein